MEDQLKVVFQTDSEIIKDFFENDPNFRVEYDYTKNEAYCAVYFASNFIYYPNDANTFTEGLIKNDRYEWVHQKLPCAHKHIFIRDIKKQWYLGGINAQINSPEKMFEFLEKETKNHKVITIGSSAGGYAAVLYGQLLGAERIYTFNGQFELNSLLLSSQESIDPLIFRYCNDDGLRPYYDLKHIIKNPEKIFYFASAYSDWDKAQSTHIRDLGINTIFFNTGHHGVPFPKIAIPGLFTLEKNELLKLRNKKQHPLLFSIKLAGLRNTLHFLSKELPKKFLK